MIMKTVTLNIDGMSCEHCTAAVKEALESITGVQSAKVSLKDAVVEYDEVALSSEETMLAALRAAVNEAGYEVN
jgi:copper chaperone CopZ